MCLFLCCKIHSQFHWSQGKSHMLEEWAALLYVAHLCWPLTLYFQHSLLWFLKFSSMKATGLGRKQLFLIFFSSAHEIRHLDDLKQSQAEALSWRDHSRDEIWSVVCQVGSTGLQVKILRSVEKLHWMLIVFYCNSFHAAPALLIVIDQFSQGG